MMNKTTVTRLWVPALLVGGVIQAASPFRIVAQATKPASSLPQTAPTASAASTSASVTQSLLDKARAFEERGRIDMSVQTWQQVLQADPYNVEALTGLARAARLNGDIVLSNTYLDRLRAVNPSDPNIARVAGLGTQQNQAAQLRQAAKLTQSGQYGAAMVIYRQVFGTNPPVGDWSVAYYETEAATADGRAHAIAGLRALTARFPADSRYPISLGRVLTYNPRTRDEGRTFLNRFPNDPQAVNAVRQSLLWDVPNPAVAPQIRAFLAAHNDPQLAQALAAMNAKTANSAAPAPATPATAAQRTRSAAEMAAYNALNAGRVDEAEARFKALLAADPKDQPAVAGMGYVRMQQGNFSGAVSFLEQARQDDPTDPALAAALDTSRFWFIMGEGQLALSQNDLTTAEKRYRAALELRPGSIEAQNGLAGTLLKAQQPAAAMPIFGRVVEADPADADAWRGLFVAQYEMGNAALALATDQRIPSAAHTQLMTDPLFLRALASAYTAVGRDRDAQTVLASALDLPFPADAKGVKLDTQIQFAGLLLAANRLDQAAGLYRQVLAQDRNNVAAWQGLVQADHASGHDAEALVSVGNMPPATYAAAMRDPGFLSIVASINQSQKKLDVAQDLLEKAIAQQSAAGQKPSLGLELQLAGIFMDRGAPQLAYPIYQSAINDNPNLVDAWAGLLAALHLTNRDKEAAAAAIPAPVRAQLENNIGYLRTMASVYGVLGQSREAALYLNRAEQDFAAENRLPPVDVEIQQAWLLFNGLDDPALYRQLMELGSRSGLTDDQRRTVETLWANWAVRRANQEAAAGNSARALAILNAAAHNFPGNSDVLKALASGYARAGQPQQAVAIYKTQNQAPASVEDFQIAIDAALAANDESDAQQWIAQAIAKYPTDPQVLILAARVAQARGNTSQAIDDYRASLRGMPPTVAAPAAKPGLPTPPTLASLPSSGQPQDLSVLLAPDTASLTSLGAASATTQSYLPGFGNVYGNVYINGQPPIAMPATATPSGPAVVPPYMTNPSAPDNGKGRLKDYVPPQARVNQPISTQSAQAEATLAVRNAVAHTLNPNAPTPAAPNQAIAEIATPESYQQQQIARLTEQALNASPNLDPAAVEYGPFVPYVAPPQPLPNATHELANYTAPTPATEAASPAPTPEAATMTPTPGTVPVHLGDATPHPAPPQTEFTDVLPTPHPPLNTRQPVMASHPDLANPEAAEARRQANAAAARTGASRPLDTPITATTQDALYATQNPGPAQIGQPSGPPSGQSNATPDTGGQQYPQPRTIPRAGGQAASSAAARTPRSQAAPAANPPPPTLTAPPSTPAPAQPAGPRAVDPGYPGGYPAGSPSASAPPPSQPYPLIGPPYPLAAPPSDAELLAGSLSARAGQVPMPPTPRQLAESQLATLEGSYSGWAGGAGIARYRGGVTGIDRLYDLEVLAEASAMIGRAVRLTVVPRAVSLNSGRINPANFTGQSSPPYLGTMPASKLLQPDEQIANGIGGELQLATRSLSLSAGYTPYEFPVHNITGSLRWRLGSHFLLFGDRSPVRDTQLSYAGLRDPGTATPTFRGNIWGGVVSTTGGFRLDFTSANGRSSFFLSGDAGILHGYHVIDNEKVEGAMGVSLRAHTWPGYGTLTLGASFFGSHYEFDEVGLTYGQGGYFSPDYYVSASLPVAFNGNLGPRFHYALSAAAGAETFQQGWEFYFPLDPILQLDFIPTSGTPCTAAQLGAHTCGEYPVSNQTAANYNVDTQAAYRFGEHWYLGGFLSANNTNNYNTVSGGFFFRYAFRRQHSTDDYPTGLFPVEGPRPFRVP
jgi:tetratricopeptide (TPR) repeat protein